MDLGGNFNNNTGVYTAPYNGVYLFCVQKRSDDNDGDFKITIDGVDTTVTGESSYSDDYPAQYGTTTVLLQLDAGQQVAVVQWGYGNMWLSTSMESWFAGYMVARA